MATKLRVVESFDGLAATNVPGTAGAVVDGSIAVGPWKLLQGADSGLRHDIRAGLEPQLRTSAELFEDPTLVGATTSVYYDRLAGRAFVVSLGQGDSSASLHLGVITTNNVLPMPSAQPLSGWCTYRFDVDGLSDGVVSLGVGSNEDWLAVTLNPVAPGQRPVLLAIDKTRVVDYVSPGDCLTLEPTAFVLDSTQLGIMPARHSSFSQSGKRPLYLVSNDAGANGSSAYVLWELRGTGPRPKLKRAGRLNAETPYSAPPAALQKGGGAIDTGDGRISSAVYRDGLVWAAHATACPDGERACVRVVAIDSGRSPGTRAGARAQITQTHTIAGKRGWHSWMPAVAVNRYGDVLVSLVQSRKNKFVESAMTLKRQLENDFGKLKRFARGRCGVPTGGNAALSQGLQADPFDDFGFWLSGLYTAEADGVCGWSTRVGHVEHDGDRTAGQVLLASGELSLPSTSSTSGPGFHNPFDLVTSLPENLGSTRGRRLVLRLRDLGRPTTGCSFEHPTSGCATIDYSCPAMELDERVVLPLAGGSDRTYHLSDAQWLVDDPMALPG